jgi:hypothetical protein
VYSSNAKEEDSFNSSLISGIIPVSFITELMTSLADLNSIFCFEVQAEYLKLCIFKQFLEQHNTFAERSRNLMSCNGKNNIPQFAQKI